MGTKVAKSSVAIAMAIAGRTARACDVCASKSAHWYCAADEAYLCTACDTQVHSANSLALRHERARLGPNGLPMKSHSKPSTVAGEDDGGGALQHRTKSKLQSPVVQVPPSRKRSRTSRHHLKSSKMAKLANHIGATHEAAQMGLSKGDACLKADDSSFAIKAELELFDFLDTDEFLNDGNQEVPSLSTVMDDSSSSPCSSSDLDLLSPDYEFQEGDHSASADSFAAFFKGKAAHSQHLSNDNSDQFLVPEYTTTFDYSADTAAATATTAAGVPADNGATAADDLPGEAFFFPGDIPGLDGPFESFAPDVDLTDDFSLSFDLALHNGVDAFEADGSAAMLGVASEDCKPGAEPKCDLQFTAGPFAKFFARKPKAEVQDAPMSPEMIRREAKEMLQCCLEGGDEEQKAVPSLQLNLKDVLTAWSDRGDPWIDYKVPQISASAGAASDVDANSSGSDVGLVPDMDAAGAGDDGQSGGDRDARVLRYKEKRRTRLFSKKIRYEVRKLNAERRPRMKGRFVKRTTATCSS